MEKRADVILLSVYGRGIWLANKLFDAGLRVAFVDLTSQMGRATTPEVEGPFGFFDFETWAVDQKTRVEEDGPTHELPTGLVLWLKGGPVEFHGPLTDYRLAQLDLDPLAVDYVRNGRREPLAMRLAKLNLLNRLPFEKQWLVALSQNLLSATYQHAAEPLMAADFTPILTRYRFRRPEELNWKKSLQTLGERGVEVFAESKLLDVAVHGREMDGVEIQSRSSGILGGKKFVWMMTAEETGRLPAEVGPRIFSDKGPSAEWYWSVMELALEKNSSSECLPEHFLVVEDLLLPWTHENFMMVHRTKPVSRKEEIGLRVWMRIPLNQRFQRGYLEERGEAALTLFRNRMTGVSCRIARRPSEFELNYEELGPCLWPMRGGRAGMAQTTTTSKVRNLYLDGPEWWSRLDWTAQFESQTAIFDQLMSWWKKEHPAEGKNHDSPVHAP